jgi:hypothetical protein
MFSLSLDIEYVLKTLQKHSYVSRTPATAICVSKMLTRRSMYPLSQHGKLCVQKHLHQHHVRPDDLKSRGTPAMFSLRLFSQHCIYLQSSKTSQYISKSRITPIRVSGTLEAAVYVSERDLNKKLSCVQNFRAQRHVYCNNL